jgi:transposase
MRAISLTFFNASAGHAVSRPSSKQACCEAWRWLKDAHQSGLYAMQRFARTLRRDIDAVRNAITERWNNGQTEGQINRLKTLRRAMYGRAGPELLRARMLPL